MFGDIFANHGIYDLRDIYFGFTAGAYHPSIAQDRNFINDPFHLV
jgi:hypothetical protein